MKNEFKIALVAIICCLALFILAITNKPKSIEDIRKDAYKDIVACALGGDSSKAKLSFDQISWHVVPENEIVIQGSDGRVASIRGIFNPFDSTIYIVQEDHRKPWINRHELAHAIGFVGHSFHPFVTCRLLPEMNDD